MVVLEYLWVNIFLHVIFLSHVEIDKKIFLHFICCILLKQPLHVIHHSVNEFLINMYSD